MIADRIGAARWRLWVAGADGGVPTAYLTGKSSTTAYDSQQTRSIAMRLSLDALVTLDAIARKGSIAATAEELHKVPSAVTYVVQKLEQDLGLLIFDRSGHRAKLTHEGTELVREGRHLLRAASDIAVGKLVTRVVAEPKPSPQQFATSQSRQMGKALEWFIGQLEQGAVRAGLPGWRRAGTLAIWRCRASRRSRHLESRRGWKT